MTDSHDLYLGVDIGGTKTMYAVAERSGSVRRISFGEGANHELCGIGGMEEILSNGIRRITADAAVTGDDLRFAYFGAAGADTEDDCRALRAVFERVSPCPGFDFSNDGYIALKSGTIDGIGIAITCGTGNVNCAVNSRGESLKLGGLAFYGGDPLGAHHIAGETFRAALRSKDRRGYPSILERLLPRALGVGSVEDVSDIERSPAVARRAVETLFEAARVGDGVALAITWDLVKETVDIVEAFSNALFDAGEAFKLVLEGSVFKHGYEPLKTMLEHAIPQRFPAEIIVPEWDPVVGSLLFALESDGVELSGDLAGSMIHSYMERRSAG